MERVLSYPADLALNPGRSILLAKLLDIAGFLRFVLRRWSEDRCPQIAGSLTYTTLLAIVPMFAVGVAVLSSAPFFEDLMSKVKVFLLLNLMPEIAGRIITVYMEEFSANAAKLTTVGVALVVGLAVALMLIMDRSLNAIWRVSRSRPYWISIVGYMALIVTGPILIAVSVSVTTYIMSLAVGMSGAWATLHSILQRLVPVSMSTVAFFLIYRIIPHRAVPWRHALVGAGVAALLFEVAKELFRVYVSYAPTYNVVYGAFAAVPVFLIWIYLSWLVILFGAELTASAAYWRGRIWKHPSTPALRFRDAVSVTRVLLEAAPSPASFKQLRTATGIAPQELEETLAQMVGSGVVIADRSQYTLAPDVRESLSSSSERLDSARESPASGVKKAKRGKARSARSSR